MRRPQILHIYAGAIILIGLGIQAGVLRSGFDTAIFSSSHFWLLAAGVVAGEFISIVVPHRQEAVTVTVGDPFTLSLLFTVGLGPALIVKSIATLIDDIRRGAVWWKVLFNVGQFSISLAAGSWLVTALGYSATTPDSPASGDIIAALLGAVTYFFMNMAIVTTAISLAIGDSPIHAFKNNFKTRVIQQGSLLGFTPVVTVAVHETSALFPLLLIPIIVVYHSGRLTQQHVTLAQQLAELYETTRITNAKVSTRDSVRELLERVCNMFNASTASITIFAREDEESAVTTSLDLTKGSYTYMQPGQPDPTQGVWARAAAENRAILLAHPISNPRLRAYFESVGVRDAMVAPMHSEDAVIGILEVFNHRDDSRTFSSEDLKLFNTLANHASIALENARLIEELEDSLAHLTEMNRLKDDFVASVSHELRTPLTSIQGFVKTLLRPDAKFSAEDQRSFLETVDRQSTRLHRLIEDLLAVSRIESRTDMTLYEVVSLRQIANDVVEEVHNRVSTGQIQLDFDGDLPVETDGGKVHQILANLVDNALKYGKKDEAVLIRGLREGEGASISVTDKGSGVPPELQDKVFDRFYQVDQTATRAVGGAGLGLYICRRMAEAIGGRIWLEKTGPAGSTFTLWVPSSPIAVVDPKALTTAGPEGTWKV